jgi:hypothetical protein
MSKVLIASCFQYFVHSYEVSTAEIQLNSRSTEAKFLDVIGTKKSHEFSSLLFTVTSTTDFTPLPLSESCLKLACNLNTVYGNLKSENSQDYAQKRQRNCTFMNSASGHIAKRSMNAALKGTVYCLPGMGENSLNVMIMGGAAWSLEQSATNLE